MADWATISALATAGGTLVLAVATFASVKSANRSARVAERALMIGLRPVFVPSREQDAEEDVYFGDQQALRVGRSLSAVVEENENVYMAIPLRNVGQGLGVLHGFHLVVGGRITDDPRDRLDAFRAQQRDLYVPPGDVSYWQGAVREEDDPFMPAARQAARERVALTIFLLYGDHEGGQRTISQFVLTPGEGSAWGTRVVRHWSLEGVDPHTF
jgi:hypothetical protein